MRDDTSTLIALLEWELAASQAREAEWRTAVAHLLSGVRYPGNDSTSSQATATVKARAVGRLKRLLAEPADDRRLRMRLESARWEASHVA